MILTFLILLLFSNGLTNRPDTSILYSRIGILIVFYSMLSSYITFYMTYLEKGIGLYGGLFNITAITHTFQIFILIICGIILLLTSFYPRKKYIGDSTSMIDTLFKKVKQYVNIINKVSEQFTIIEYALIIIFVISGATLLLSSGDLGSIYLCIELQSFSLYIISSLHRNSESSTGSALTYFLLGGLSSCFILLGIGLIYANSGLTSLDGIYLIISDSERYVDYSTWYMHSYVFYSLILISVGLLFKIAAAPFHWWSPDVYDGVPTIVTTFIAILGKIAILVLLLELVQYTSSLLHSTVQFYSWTTSLSISCFFSLLIGTVLGITQTRIKRLLAYSTISHVGFILLALSISSIESIQAFIFYLLQYSISNLNAFIILIAIGFSLYYYTSENKEYKEGRIYSDQQYAIETFATTGSGNLIQSKALQSNHYMLNKDNENSEIYKSKLNTINNVHRWIKSNRSTLAFCPRWLENEKIKGVSISLNEMARKNNPPIVVEYPALEDIEGSLVSHFEHTIYVHDNSTEVFTYGDDY